MPTTGMCYSASFFMQHQYLLSLTIYMLQHIKKGTKTLLPLSTQQKNIPTQEETAQ